LPRAVFESDPFYCPPRDADVLASAHRERFGGRQRFFLVTDRDRCVGRVVARISPGLKDPEGAPLGLLGFFEALDRPVETNALLRAATSWLQDSGVRRIVGPMDGDTWHRYRMNVGPCDAPPFLGEPHNPPYYPQLWENAGFRTLETYFSQQVEDVSAVVPRFEPMLRRVQARGYHLRPIDLRRFDDELRILFDLSRRIFRDNLLYDDISWEEFRELYVATRPLLDDDLVWFAQQPNGKYVGFLFAYRDLHRAVAAMRGRHGLLAKMRFWLHRGEADAVNLKSFGVMPGYRHTGVGPALVCRVYQRMLAKGFRRANLCLIRDGNPSGRMDGGRGTLLRRYVLYEWSGQVLP